VQSSGVVKTDDVMVDVAGGLHRVGVLAAPRTHSYLLGCPHADGKCDPVIESVFLH